MAKKNQNNSIAFISGFLLGGAIGALVGMLLAPKSGNQTRSELVDQSEAWRHRAEEMAARVSEKISPTIEGIKSQAAATGDLVKQRVEPVAGLIGQAKEHAEDMAGETHQHAEELAGEAAQHSQDLKAAGMRHGKEFAEQAREHAEELAAEGKGMSSCDQKLLFDEINTCDLFGNWMLYLESSVHL